MAADRLWDDSSDDWPVWEQLVPHLNALYSYVGAKLADDDLAVLARVATWGAMAFVWAGYYPASQDLAESALAYTARLGADHPAVLHLRSQVAIALELRGKAAEAEHEFRDILAYQTRVLGPDHPMTWNTQSTLAALVARTQRGGS